MRCSGWCLLALVPLCVAWQGSGGGELEWSGGTAKTKDRRGDATAEVVARLEDDHWLHLVATVELPRPNGDAVMGLRVAPGFPWRDGVDLPDSRVQIAYTEYTIEGELDFAAVYVLTGHLSGVRNGPADGSLVGTIDVENRHGVWRRLDHLRLSFSPVDQPEQVSHDGSDHADNDTYVGGEAVVSGGCDASTYDDSDTYASPSDSGGCDGDTFDSSSSDSGSSGGCAGDNVGDAGDSSSGCGDSCTGDAIAADGTRRRRGWARRVIGWLPWFFVFGCLRLMRRVHFLFV